jgi:hypothetical protein
MGNRERRRIFLRNHLRITFYGNARDPPQLPLLSELSSLPVTITAVK